MDNVLLFVVSKLDVTMACPLVVSTLVEQCLEICCLLSEGEKSAKTFLKMVLSNGESCMNGRNLYKWVEDIFKMVAAP